MRRDLEKFWKLLRKISYVGLVRRDALKSYKLLQRVFGRSCFNPRFIITILLVSGLLTVSVIEFQKFLLSPDHQIRTNSYLVNLSANMAGGWLSLALTMYLLRYMAVKGTSIGILAGTVVLDFVAALVFGVMAILTAVLIAQVFPLTPKEPKPDLFNSMVNGVVFLSLAFLTSVWPTFLHVGISTIFVLSKLFRPLIQKPICILIFPFTESRKGPLTLLAIGVGTVTKLAHQWLKYVDTLPVS